MYVKYPLWYGMRCSWSFISVVLRSKAHTHTWGHNCWSPTPARLWGCSFPVDLHIKFCVGWSEAAVWCLSAEHWPLYSQGVNNKGCESSDNSYRWITTLPLPLRNQTDDARSEATFQFHVKDFSKLKDTLLSPPCSVRSLPWKIMVMPRTSSAQDRSPQRCLGFFLQCNGQSQSTSWSCNAVADLRLLSVKEGQEPFTRSKFVYTFPVVCFQ